MDQYNKPDVSVIIPFRNAEKTIELCIHSVLNQKLHAVEILAVNNCSDDAGPDIVRAITDKRLRLLDEPIPGAAAARNRGLDNVSGEYVLFLDADVELTDSQWLSRAMAKVKSKRSDGIVGVGGIGRSSHPSEIAHALDILLYGRSPDADRSVSHLPTMDLLMCHEDIGKERFLPELLAAEDPEFCFRFADKGLYFLLASDLTVKHHHPTDLKGLIQRWYRYGLYYRKPYALHPRQKSMGYRIRMAFIAFTFFSLGLIAIDWCAVLLPFCMVLGLFLSYIWHLKQSNLPSHRLFIFAALHTVKQLSHLLGITASMMGVKMS